MDREIRFRRSVYPRMIKDGKMTKEKAEYEIRAMEAVKDCLMMMPREASLVRCNIKTK